MEVLGLDSIMSDEQINNLFMDENDTEETQNSSAEKEQKEPQAIEVDAENLFEESPESVDSKGTESNQEGKGTTQDNDGTPPKNFYSSIAKALKGDGALPDLSDEDISKVKDAEGFAEIFEQQVKARLDEKVRRVDEALNYGVEPTVIKQYESTISYLNSISEDSLKSDTDEGVDLRKKLIFQDLLNKGYSKEEASEELQDIFDNGNDIKKASRALANNKEFFDKSYKEAIENARKEAEEEKEMQRKQAESLRKSLIEEDTIFGQKLDRTTRQNIYNSISKPVYKDPESGELLTALQKFERENKTDFLKIIGYFFERTDHFKNLDKIIKPEVNKSVKKNIRELEHTLNNTSRASDGSLRYISGVGDDPNSFIGTNWDLDI